MRDTDRDVASVIVALRSADITEPAVAEMMRLERLTRWLPADNSGWDALTEAIKDAKLEGATFN